jgi:hypothetical protein
MQPGCIPSPMVIQDDDHQFGGGEKQAELRPLPRPQLQGSSSSLLGRRAGQVGAYLHVGWRPASSSGIQGVAQHVVRHEGGTRVPGRSRSRSCGESGSEDLPVRFGAAAVRWCGVGGQVATVVGAEVVVAIGEAASAEAVASADDTVSATCAPGLRLFGFNGWFSSPVRGHERGPSSGSVCSGAIAAVVLPSETEVAATLLVQRSPASHPEFVVPQALWCGGCSYPPEWNRSPVCNGTLSMGACSLWLSRPEHLGIWA